MALALSPLAYQAIEGSIIGGNVVAIMNQYSKRIELMTDMYLLGQAKTTNPLVDVAGIPVNVITQEQYIYQADITTNPIESGAKLTDHVIINPLKVSINFEVVNFPDMDQKYVFGLLETMFKNRQTTTLLTKHKQLENMIMTGFQPTNSLPNWGGFRARAEFQQIGLVTVQTAKISRKDASPNGASKKNVEKTATDSTKKGEAKKTPVPSGSTASQLFK
jgi:hypothetical protein